MASTPTSPHANCRLVDVAGKGKGLIAARRLTRGTLIVAEEPIITAPDRGSNSQPAIVAAVVARGPAVIAELMAFSGPEPTADPTQAMIARVKHFLPLGDGECGLFRYICRVNHSCRPNAMYHWNERLKKGGESIIMSVLQHT